jgi:hypothetical protein
MQRTSSIYLLAALVLGACASRVGIAEEIAAPPTLAEIVAAYEAKAKAIQDRARAEIAAEQTRTIDALRMLREQFVKEGKVAEADVVAAEIRKLNTRRVGGAAGVAVAAPASPAQWRGRVGESYFCELTGAIGGSVWGTDVYTDDSDLQAAAVHAGALKVDETGVVKITICAPLESYPSSERNGVAAREWGAWDGAYTIERAKDAELPPAPMDDGAAIANPGTLTTLAKRPGDVFLIALTGVGGRPVWGTDVYTTDSDLATAAVHAGIVKMDERCVVKVIVADGQGEYSGSTRNDITSSPWGSYSLSYRFAKPE